MRSFLREEAPDVNDTKIHPSYHVKLYMDIIANSLISLKNNHDISIIVIYTIS